jgi:hypothetical protein
VSKTPDVLVASLCFLLAVLVGAFRQMCTYLMAPRITPVEATDKGRPKTFYLGTYFPVWRSRLVRYGTWLFVAVTSIFAGVFIGAVVSHDPAGNDIWAFLTAALTLRWVLSYLLAWGGVRWAYKDAQAQSLLVPATANLGSAQTSSLELKTLLDVSNFIKTYHLQPRPELIGNLIEALHPSGFLRNNINPLIGFFSEIFTANPNRLPQWQVLISKQDEQTKAALDHALSASKRGGVLNVSEHAAGPNDVYWGAFFASGNPKFVYRLVDQLRYFDERNDEALFLAGGGAKLSLASAAQAQPAVRSAIEDARTKADKRTQELISEVLAQNPESIKVEIKEILQKQREAGKWK